MAYYRTGYHQVYDCLFICEQVATVAKMASQETTRWQAWCPALQLALCQHHLYKYLRDRRPHMGIDRANR